LINNGVFQNITNFLHRDAPFDFVREVVHLGAFTVNKKNGASRRFVSKNNGALMVLFSKNNIIIIIIELV